MAATAVAEDSQVFATDVSSAYHAAIKSSRLQSWDIFLAKPNEGVIQTSPLATLFVPRETVTISIKETDNGSSQITLQTDSGDIRSDFSNFFDDIQKILSAQ